MQEFINRIRNEGIHVGGGIVKVDSFINHQVDAGLMYRLGQAFVQRFAAAGVNDVSKVLTAEVSGITPALMTAQALSVPMIYARKQRSAAMTDQYYLAPAKSRTSGDGDQSSRTEPTRLVQSSSMPKGAPVTGSATWPMSAAA